jgi:hypothetical protein
MPATQPISTLRLDPDLNRALVAPPPQLNSQQLCVIGAPEAYRVHYPEVCAIEVPPVEYHEKTGNASYQPMPYASFIDGARDQMASVLDADPVFETYALNKSGSQMFGMIGFGTEHTGQAITVALRSSYDKSIANQVAIGSAPFVCANGCFSGDHMISAKHTTNVFATLAGMLQEITNDSILPVLQRIEMIQDWKNIPVHDDLFGTYLGILFIRNLLRPNSLTASARYWRSCHDGTLHAEHGNQDLYSAYQAVTAAGQRSSPVNAFRHFAGIDHATKAIADAGGSMTEAHIPTFDLRVREYIDVGEAK